MVDLVDFLISKLNQIDIIDFMFLKIIFELLIKVVGFFRLVNITIGFQFQRLILGLLVGQIVDQYSTKLWAF